MKTARKAKRKPLEDFLVSSPSTNNVLRLGEDYDYLADALFRNVRELYNFEEELRKFGLSRLEEIHFIEELACEKFVP